MEFAFKLVFVIWTAFVVFLILVCIHIHQRDN